MNKLAARAVRILRRIRFRIGEALSGLREPVRTAKEYAAASMEWLLRAQTATLDGGVAEGYNVLTAKWESSYPETTGYIICSLLRTAKADIGNPAELRSACMRMGTWLLTTQFDCGAFPGGNAAIGEKVPTVFNTGQILKGLTDLISEGLDDDGRFAQAANRAAQWLEQVQDKDGAWSQGRSPLTEGIVHSYDVRTAWALTRYGRRVGCPVAVKAGIRHAEWLCSMTDSHGWFPHMSFCPDQPPLTHTVAYTIQGLLEIGVLCERADFITAATNAAHKMRALVNPETGALPGQIEAPYCSAAEWTSATGNAQMAVIWFRLAQITGDSSWQEPARAATRFNCSLQELDINSPNPGRRGGLRGSYPGHLGYGRFRYMNWTQKFHLDALLAQMGVYIT